MQVKSLNGVSWSQWYIVLQIIILPTATTCNDPDEVSNAVLLKHGRRINDTVTYKCNNNFRIIGTITNQTNATCVLDEAYRSIWTNVPTCEGQSYTFVDWKHINNTRFYSALNVCLAQVVTEIHLSSSNHLSGAAERHRSIAYNST